MNYDVGFFWSEVNDRIKKRIDFLKENDYVYVTGDYWRCPEGKLHRFDQLYKEVKNRKPTPPEPIWLEPDYLPNYETALNTVPDFFNDGELMQAADEKNHELIFDIESYPNYFLIVFKSFTLNKVCFYELIGDQRPDINDLAKLNWIAHNFCLIGFNSMNYDIPILQMAVAGLDARLLQEATDDIIVKKIYPNKVMQKYNVKHDYSINTFDIMPIAPLKGSLKLYGARAHTEQIQDLPFKPGTNLTKDQIVITRWYCLNDLQNTFDVRQKLDKAIKLRYEMSKTYGIDLRSKSDAQIAEAVIKSEVKKRVGEEPRKPNLEKTLNTTFTYTPPSYINFKTDKLRSILQSLECSEFRLRMNEKEKKLEWYAQQGKKEIVFKYYETVYKMGLGGLHSQEKSVNYQSNDEFTLKDRDVASYYPALILNSEKYPEQIGPVFLEIFKTIVDNRLHAKGLAKTGETEQIRADNKSDADSLKIVINGTFGKLNDRFSVMFSPGQMLHVTLSGQLSLFMLIEMMELNNVTVISANTDGIIFKCPVGREKEIDDIIADWEKQTGLDTEETIYTSLYNRDVNSYIAVEGNKTKLKGKIYGKPGLNKNPTNEISIIAVENWIKDKTPLEETVRNCKDITKFVTVTNVKGGAYKDGEYLGKVVRWYYSTNCKGPVLYAMSGNQVPRSQNARPLMKFEKEFPIDIDYNWYIEEARSLLEITGVTL